MAFFFLCRISVLVAGCYEARCAGYHYLYNVDVVKGLER